jgi:hypothetical protein
VLPKNNGYQQNYKIAQKNNKNLLERMFSFSQKNQCLFKMLYWFVLFMMEIYNKSLKTVKLCFDWNSLLSFDVFRPTFFGSLSLSVNFAFLFLHAITRRSSFASEAAVSFADRL